jgi:hypothetical protein
MKKIFTLLAAVFMTAAISGQSPDKMSYQAVIRDVSGNLVTEQEIGMQISILQGSPNGASVYIETQTPTTNTNGLVGIEIGGDDAIVLIGSFSNIDWSDGPYFIKTETDPSGGTDYTITGTSQLLSMPYAFHARTAETILEPIVESDPLFEASPSAGIEASDIANWDEAHLWGDHAEEGYLTEETQDLAEVLSLGNDADGNQIQNLADPTDAQDAATKAYVDGSVPIKYEIGDFAHGGVVFYVEPGGTRGLVAAIEDWNGGATIKWSGGSTSYNTMARGDEVYAGKMNTAIIISVHSAKDDFDDHAALVCANYKGGDFGNWYLPSEEELNQMWINKSIIDATAIANGGSAFASAAYWSSTEGGDWSARGRHFGSPGGAILASKAFTGRVRAARAF